MSDRREQSHKWWNSFDEKSMRLVIEGDNGEEIHVPARYEVCETCQGRGHHVNPSIDSNGLSVEDFAEDPGFAEDYLSGVYDQPCVECHGNRVIPVVDEYACSPDLLNMVNEVIEAHYADQAERAAERRMGY